MTERKITDQLMEFINRGGVGCFVVKYYGSGMTRRGVPDLIGSWQQMPFAIEVKQPDLEGHTTLAQHAWLQTFNRGGYVTGVVSSIPDFHSLFP